MSSNNGNGKNPLDSKLTVSSRFASRKMQKNFSNQKRYLIWRQLWTNIAKCGKDIGLQVTSQEIKAMEENINKIIKEAVADQESLIDDEIIAHANIFFKQCSLQGPLTKLALLSDFISDNTILIMTRDGFDILFCHIAKIIKNLSSVALQHKLLPIFSSSTSMTTVGEIMAEWINDLLIDQKVMQRTKYDLKFRGLGASEINAGIIGKFFNYNNGKIKKLNKCVANLLEFKDIYPNIGESYPRKIDFEVLSSVYTLGGTIYRILTGLQILINKHEINNPFEDCDTANSMNLQRCLALTRHMMTINSLPAYTRSLNWLQRKAEDELNRKISLIETFVTADAVLFTLASISEKIIVHQNEIEHHLEEELPLKCASTLVATMVRKGEDKRACREIVSNFMEKYKQEIKYNNFDNSLIDKIKMDDMYLQPIFDELEHILNFENSIKRIATEVEEFIQEHVEPFLKENLAE